MENPNWLWIHESMHIYIYIHTYWCILNYMYAVYIVSCTGKYIFAYISVCVAVLLHFYAPTSGSSVAPGNMCIHCQQRSSHMTCCSQVDFKFAQTWIQWVAVKMAKKVQQISKSASSTSSFAPSTSYQAWPDCNCSIGWLEMFEKTNLALNIVSTIDPRSGHLSRNNH